MIPVAIAAFALILAVAYLIGRPFVAPLRYTAEASLEQLHADRDRVRSQLRELEMDFETGKLAQDEYDKLRSRRLQQIEATTRAMRDAEPKPEPEPDADAEGETAPVDLELERTVEERILARRHVLEELEALACPGCGTTIDPDDRFCRKCGADLATAENEVSGR